jgi:hypothetical protein
VLAGWPRRRDITTPRRVRADIEPAGPYDHRRWTFAPPRPPEGPIPAGGHLVCVGSDHPAARHPLSTSPFSAAITGRFMPIQSCRQQEVRPSLRASTTVYRRSLVTRQSR